MAKTAQDYMNQGIAMAAENQPRPLGDSWQAKAQQKGFDSVVSATKTPGIGQGSVEVRECHPVAHNPTTADIRPQSVPQKQQTQNAVQSHVNALYRQALDPKTPTMRAYKIGEKIGALIDKWKSKGVIIHANSMI